ncbi:MAG: methylated-DNA--[protein]-cysteine S-methyltransferase, partial [Deinococcales bacterium]
QRYAGVTLKQFLKHLTRKAALERLRAGRAVLDTAMEVGLSGPGRLHDLLVTTEAVTPGDARRRGKGVAMGVGSGETPFGSALLAWTNRGISFLAFTRQRGVATATAELRRQWPDADLRENGAEAARRLDAVFDGTRDTPLPVWLRGSPFQLKVWEALLAIPPGTHWSYGELADMLGQGRAARAVGSAVGRNPVAWIIPCHRVIASSGELGGYRWGCDTKRAMIGVEACALRQESASDRNTGADGAGSRTS